MGCEQSKTAADPLDHRGRSAGRGDKESLTGEEIELSEQKQRHVADDWRIIKSMGGSLSSIYMVVAQNRLSAQLLSNRFDNHANNNNTNGASNNNIHVLQVIDMKQVAPERRRSMRKEIQMLKNIRHPNILTVCDVYDSQEQVSMVTELCTGGDLQCRSNTPVPEARARTMIQQILHAVHYMHTRGVYSHKLSTENIMLQDDSADAAVKIAHAGLSSAYASNGVPNLPNAREPRSDIYSIGMIAFALLSGGKEPPTCVDDDFDDGNDYQPKINLFMGQVWTRIRISRNAKRFIDCCIQPDPKVGFSVAQALEHPWILNRKPSEVQRTAVVSDRSTPQPPKRRDSKSVSSKRSSGSSHRSSGGVCIDDGHKYSGRGGGICIDDGLEYNAPTTETLTLSRAMIPPPARSPAPQSLSTEDYDREMEAKRSREEARLAKDRRLAAEARLAEKKLAAAAAAAATVAEEARRVEVVQQLSSVIVIQSVWRKFQAQGLLQERMRAAATLRDRREHAVVVIQKNWRGSRCRHSIAVARLASRKEESAIAIQKMCRGYIVFCQIIRRLENRTKACLHIQSNWRAAHGSRKFITKKKAVVMIQSHSRTFLALRETQKRRSATAAVVHIQSCARMAMFRGLLRTKMQHRSLAALRLQTRWRMERCRLEYKTVIKGVTSIQAVHRGHNDRRRLQVIGAQCVAAVSIQSAWRRAICRQHYAGTLQMIVFTQSIYRRVLGRRRAAELRAAILVALLLQSNYRMSRCRTEFTTAKFSAVQIQSTLRRVQAQHCLNNLQAGLLRIQSVISIQSAVRMHGARVQLASLKVQAARTRAAVAVQSAYRGYQARAEFSSTNRAAVSIQSAYRRLTSQNLLTSLKAAHLHSLLATTKEVEVETESTMEETTSIASHSEPAIVERNQAQLETPSEFRILHEIFRGCQNDLGSDGVVTVEFLKHKLRSKYTADEVESWFQCKFDDSRNVNYTEVLAKAIQSRRKTDRMRVKDAFQRIDKGRRGFVTVGNLRAVLGTDNSEHIEQLIKEADTKRDGRITYGTFQKVLNRWNRREVV